MLFIRLTYGNGGVGSTKLPLPHYLQTALLFFQHTLMLSTISTT